MPRTDSRLWQRLAITALAGLLVASQPVAAAAQDADAEREQQLRRLTEPVSSVEIGLGWVSRDSFRFGRYSGLEQRGLFPIINVAFYRRSPWHGADAHYLELRGRDLGIASRRLSLRAGDQSRWQLRLGFDAIPHHEIDDARTIFRPPGGSRLDLPAGWVAGTSTAAMSALQASLQPLEIRRRTRRAEIGGSVRLPSGWSLHSDWREQRKDGHRVVALTMGSSGGNSRAALAAAPIDARTRQLDTLLSYADPKRQMHLGYHLSLYDNDAGVLDWQNPFASVAGWDAAAGHPGGRGRMRLEPDNRYHQLLLGGGWSPAAGSRLSGELAWGRARQNEPFLAYTTNPVLAANIAQPLPAASLGGEIATTRAALRFHHQLAARLSLGASYLYDERDNQTPRREFVTMGGDAVAQNLAATSVARRYNEPRSFRDQRLRFDVGWRARPWLRLNLDGQHRQMDRSHQERERIDEQRIGLRVAAEAESLAASLRLGHAHRDGSRYNGSATLFGGFAPGYIDSLLPLVDGLPFINLPGLRKFDQADRQRQGAEFALDWTASPRLSLGLNLQAQHDDYQRSEFGLQSSRMNAAQVDLSWQLAERGSLHGFVGEERYHSDQTGRAFNGGAVRPTHALDPNRNWRSRGRDAIATQGLGYQGTFASDRLRLRLDWLRSRVDSDIRTTTGSALVRADLPSVRSDLRALDLQASWRLHQDMDLRWRLLREHYRSHDWALDGVGPNQLANIITLGESSPDYRVWVSMVSLAWRF